MMNTLHSFVQNPGWLLVLQLGIIFVVTWVCGRLVGLAGQPRVVGEIAGGILLGPLALGYALPNFAWLVFPANRLHPLDVVSNVGLVLFLFLIGTELDLDAVRSRWPSVSAIALGSIAVPLLLGIGVGFVLLGRFEVPVVSRLGFLLFLGIAMSITALPVLARILEDRKRVGRPVDAGLSATALTCAAANDLVAWVLLAITLTLLHGDDGALRVAARLFGVIGYIALMLLAVRPAAAYLRERSPGSPAWVWLCSMTVVAFVSARITESLGIHAFLGAFLAGVCVPRRSADLGEINGALRGSLKWVMGLALPVFFAMTGLRMRPEMFQGSGIGWLLLVLLVAVVGKIGGAALAARASGMEWDGAVQIGILMNTRGLVELIVLNVGYQERILSPVLFTVFVLMAILTTAMTVPLLSLHERGIVARG